MHGGNRADQVRRNKALDVGDQVRAALGRRSVVIADLTQTWTCVLAAIGDLFRAHDRAARSGWRLRIVVSSAALMHEFVLAGLDSELQTYPNLRLACEAAPGVSSGRLTWSGG